MRLRHGQFNREKEAATLIQVIDWTTIANFVTEVFIRYGVPEADAAICTDVLLESDRRGIESHGCNRFQPIYLDRMWTATTAWAR